MLEVKKLANLNVCIIKLTGPSECIFEHSIVTIQFVSDIGSCLPIELTDALVVKRCLTKQNVAAQAI